MTLALWLPLYDRTPRKHDKSPRNSELHRRAIFRAVKHHKHAVAVGLFVVYYFYT